MHPIDELIPLWAARNPCCGRAQPHNYADRDRETAANPPHARHTYAAHEILWNMRFADILSRMPDGQHIDYTRFP